MTTSTTKPRPMQEKKKGDQAEPLRLLRLSLENFKGVRQFTLEPNGLDLGVFGDNAAGKTTLADAFSWLLFGKDSLGRTGFEIKTLSANGEAMHGVEHSVDAELSVGGERIALRKVYREKWTKRRGSAEKEFTGHTRDHFINSVPVTQSEYEDRIEHLGTEQVFRLLTNPIEFAERLHWQERRGLLLEVCGDISGDDVIASSQDLSDLADALDGRAIDDHRKVIQARKRKVNDELQRIPVRIDEVTRGLPEIGADENGLQSQLDTLRDRRAEVESERSRIKSGGEIAERTKRIREIESELIKERNRQSEIAGESVGELRARHSKIEAERRLTEDAIQRKEKSIEIGEKDQLSLDELMDSKRAAWHELDGQTFEPKAGGDICAACGQNLPKEHVDEARRKAEAEFNADKATRLREIAEEGKRLRLRHDESKLANEKALKAIEQSKKDLEAAVQKLEELQLQIAEHEEIPRAPSARQSELEAAKANLEAEITELRKGTETALSSVDEKLEALNAEIIEAEGKISRIAQRREGEKRLEQLRLEERRLAHEFEELERQIYLCEEFTRQKVSLLTERINSRFELARFKLFNTLVNGGIEECCEIAYGGVPWSSLNTGAQVNIGLDVIRTLSEHYGFAPCVFIDHAESVTQLIETPGQQIRLIVSEQDKELRVEELS